jgi:hypothetical protein
MDDWRDRLDRSPKFRKIRQAVWQKWRRLADDKEFLLETARLKDHLTPVFLKHPEEVRSFFHPTFQPTLARIEDIRSRIRRVANEHLRFALQRYVRYVLRFGVVMQLEDRAPHFRTHDFGTDPTNKFHVKVVKNNLEPQEPFWWDEQTPISDYFGSPKVTVGVELQRLIDAGVAKFVQIEDGKKRSLLTQLMDFAYSPDELTFLLLNMDQPYVLCLIGERISVDDIWRRASRVVSEFQKLEYGRTMAGRPRQVRKLHRELNRLLRDPGTPLKEKATELANGDQGRHVYSKMSALSQLKRKLRW